MQVSAQFSDWITSLSLSLTPKLGMKSVTAGQIKYSFHVTNDRDALNLEQFSELLGSHPDAFGRCEKHGHITASAVLANDTFSHMVMVYHAKLGMWLPPGGHCDSDNDMIRVCRKEVLEETGHDDILPLTDAIFDIDIHAIPSNGSSREHLHYDIRFAFQADMSKPLVLSQESTDIRWVPILKMRDYTTLPSVLVLAEKLVRL